MKKSCKPDTPLIVLVDDEPDILFGTSIMLRQAGFSHIKTMDDSRNLLPFLVDMDVAVVVLDLQMAHLTGKELLNHLAEAYPQVPVIIVTAANELDTAVECIKKGAFDYLVKPIEAERFTACIHKALEMNALRREIFLLRENILSGKPQNEAVFAAIKTRNSAMKALFNYLEAIGPTAQPVLLTGETGVGKELFARAIHDLSGRKGAFIAVNSAGLDELMFSDTLFGHKRAAFTGADQSREGMISRAAGGTLFLDEIGDLNLPAQIKLLRLLQEGEYYPLGSDLPVRSQARIVVATNSQLEEMILTGSFRKDLYYRLCAHKVNIPPLRKRADDIPLLIETFLEEAAGSLQKKIPGYPPELLSCLGSYAFPGNIRELRAMIFDAVTRHKGGQLSITSFRRAIGEGNPKSGFPLNASARYEEFLNSAEEFPTLKEFEQCLVKAALNRSSGNQRAAAALLGISRQALNQRINKIN